MTEVPVGDFIDTVAWVYTEDGRVLCARPRGKDVFYVPGGKREAGETDMQTLLREIEEELTVALLPDTVRHLGVYEAVHAEARVRMSCYTADYRGVLTAGSEIEELAWFGYDRRAHVPPVDRLLFDELRAGGLLR
ncbi:NUDIX hydrolase [Nocardia brevicatena]|uniref:NUDIX hydrolase n=1 Tax=Nocardia brevicatena TaxID=37327 RepID=UPI000594DCCD|nr:NUDIX domain-containing protein [Nocardia brevicatena]